MYQPWLSSTHRQTLLAQSLLPWGYVALENLPETLRIAQPWTFTMCFHGSQGRGMGCYRVFAYGNSWRKLCHQISVLKVSGCFCAIPACTHLSWHLSRYGERHDWGKMNEANTGGTGAISSSWYPGLHQGSLLRPQPGVWQSRDLHCFQIIGIPQRANTLWLSSWKFLSNTGMWALAQEMSVQTCDINIDVCLWQTQPSLIPGWDDRTQLPGSLHIFLHTGGSLKSVQI